MSIIPADNGKLWLGTLIGLYLYDIGTDTPVKMDLKHSSPEKLTRILSLFMDKDKNLWIGAKESLSKYTVTENNTLSDTAGYKFTNIVQTQCILQSKDGKYGSGPWTDWSASTNRTHQESFRTPKASRTARYEASRKTAKVTCGSVPMTACTDTPPPVARSADSDTTTA